MLTMQRCHIYLDILVQYIPLTCELLGMPGVKKVLVKPVQKQQRFPSNYSSSNCNIYKMMRDVCGIPIVYNRALEEIARVCLLN